MVTKTACFGKFTVAILNTKRLQFEQQWRGNSGNLTYGDGHTNSSISGSNSAIAANSNATTTAALAQQQPSTALHTATALVVNSPVKVKARTSNVYVQNVTRCHINITKFVKFVF